MKWIGLVFSLVLAGCQSSHETSFHNLSTAFTAWYFKYHPVESTRYGMKSNHGDFRWTTTSGMEEYQADISRFMIELSQIDATKISPETRIDYNILYSKLKQLQWEMTSVKPWEWNPLHLLDEISEGLYLLSEREDIKMDERVEAVQSRLKKIPKALIESQDILVYSSNLHFDHARIKIDKLILLLQQLPLKLNSDNITLDQIDDLIGNAVSSLIQHQEWLKEKNHRMEKFNFPQALQLNDWGFSYYTGKKYQVDVVRRIAEKNLITTQNNMFHLALPVYLLENDEPVWLDRDDTLEVIQWTINSTKQDPKYIISGQEILSAYFESLTNLEKFCLDHALLPRTILKTMQLQFAPEYHFSIAPVYIFDHHPKDYTAEALYNINPPEEDHVAYGLTKKEVDILNAKLILPGFGIQLAHAQKHPSTIRYLFPDPITKAGWQAYSLSMLVEAGFEANDLEFRLLQLREELTAVIRAIGEEQYYSGVHSRKDVIHLYQTQAFLDGEEAERIQLDSDLHYFSGTQSFIGMMEMQSFLAEFQKKMGDDFEISDFHSAVLQDGMVPLFELKKIVLSR